MSVKLVLKITIRDRDGVMNTERSTAVLANTTLREGLNLFGILECLTVADLIPALVRLNIDRNSDKRIGRGMRHYGKG